MSPFSKFKIFSFLFSVYITYRILIKKECTMFTNGVKIQLVDNKTIIARTPQTEMDVNNIQEYPGLNQNFLNITDVDGNFYTINTKQIVYVEYGRIDRNNEFENTNLYNIRKQQESKLA